MRVPVVVAFCVVAAALPTTTGCSSRCTSFALSLASDRGGQATAVAAAEWFARHGGTPGLPTGGWHQTGTDGAGATLASGHATVHVLHQADGTWQVDSGCS